MFFLFHVSSYNGFIVNSQKPEPLIHLEFPSIFIKSRENKNTHKHTNVKFNYCFLSSALWFLFETWFGVPLIKLPRNFSTVFLFRHSCFEKFPLSWSKWNDFDKSTNKIIATIVCLVRLTMTERCFDERCSPLITSHDDEKQPKI